METRIATIQDHQRLLLLYRTYYPAGHPLYNQQFWAWMFTNPTYGQCIIAENSKGDITGHLGCILQGDFVWLVNILIDPAYRQQHLPDLLFERARQYGHLAVAVANEAGAALLRRKHWQEHPLLQRKIWVRPGKDFRRDALFFKPVDRPAGMAIPQGYLWQQPGLQSVALAWGDTAQLALDAGGIRLVTCHNPAACVQWATAHGFNWIDFVTSDTDAALHLHLTEAGFAELPDFPWYVNPPDFDRKVTLNFFTEIPLPEGFVFNRTMADMIRIGRID